MEKIKRTVIPCGYLHDPNGNHYYLLHPVPIALDTWVGDGRQAWSAVKADWDYEQDTDKSFIVPVGGQVTVVCSTQSTIELCTVDPIEIDGYSWEEAEAESRDLQKEYGNIRLSIPID